MIEHINCIRKVKYNQGWYGRDVPESELINGDYDSVSYGDFTESSEGSWITSDLWSYSDYSGCLVEQVNYKDLGEFLESENILHVKLFGGYNTNSICIFIDSITSELVELLKSLDDYPLINDETWSNLQYTELENQISDYDYDVCRLVESRVKIDYPESDIDCIDIKDMFTATELSELMLAAVREYDIEVSFETRGNLYIQDLDKIAGFVYDKIQRFQLSRPQVESDYNPDKYVKNTWVDYYNNHVQ